ncbi:MAG TPA: hypothetical protein VHR64_00615 [Thermomicrobiales bacterium]|nr:hypothetical protein [Thermomicrobiales bacterium]
MNHLSVGRTIDVQPKPRTHRDGRALLAIIVISVLVIAGLWGISRSAPSAKQLDSVSLVTTGVSGEQGCANFADFWMRDSGLHVPAEAIEGMSNCRLSMDGTWFVPANAADPRLPADDHLTAQEREQVAVLSTQLADDIQQLEQILPRSLMETLKVNYTDENRPVFGHTKKGRQDLGAKWARYVQISQAYLLEPEHNVLADYVGWAMGRRLDAVSAFEDACFADPANQFLWRACKGLRAEFAVNNIPLYWDLSDPVMIQEYLIDRVRSGQPLPAPTPAAGKN